MAEKILFVDDDVNVLAAFKRMFRPDDYTVETAHDGSEGLQALSDHGPFAVVLADMRMPGMNGIELLTQVRQRAPDTVRMMLTGNTDIETALQAVNEGNVFRFLTKPCLAEALLRAVKMGVEQYRMITAERTLLEETLNATIKVLTDVLSLVNPEAFGRAARLRLYVKHVAEQLSLPNAWQFETAAMLSQIGCVALPPEIVEKVSAGQPLSRQEREAYASHPTVAGKLLAGIPRLGDVANMISRQQEPLCRDQADQDTKRRDPVTLGGHILKVALDFDRMVNAGAAPKAAVEELRSHADAHDREIVEALEALEVCTGETVLSSLNVEDLDVGMVLEQDVRAKNGNLLVTRGQELTCTIVVRLRRWKEGIGVAEPIRVRIPRVQLAEQMI